MSKIATHGMFMAGLILLAGCAHAPPQLYSWNSFPDLQYATLLHDGASPDEQIHAMEEEAADARSENAILPPGFRAHLGLLYLNAGNTDRARELWLEEKNAFPESAPYMDQLLGRLQPAAKPADAAKKGDGA